MRASILDISREKSSEPEMVVKGGLLAKRFSKAHGNGGLAGAVLANKKDDATGELAFMD